MPDSAAVTPTLGGAGWLLNLIQKQCSSSSAVSRVSEPSASPAWSGASLFVVESSGALLPLGTTRRPLCVFVSVGDGNIISGIHKGFRDLAELGWLEQMPRIFGVQAAAQHYFGKSAHQLTRSEAARLAVMLPNPRYYESRPASPYLQARARTIAARMAGTAIP